MSDHAIVVRQLESASDAVAYTAFLLRCPAATVYHSLPFRDLVLACTGAEQRYALAWRGEELIGALPMMFADGPFGRVANSLPFFGSHGDILANDVGAIPPLQRWFRDQMESENLAAATIVTNPFDGAAAAGWPDAAFKDTRIAQWTQLADEADGAVDIRAVVDGTARRNLSKAMREGVSVEVDNTAIKFLADCHSQNMTEIGGRVKPESFFAALPGAINPGRDFRIYVAKQNGNSVAALLLFFFKDFVEYIMPVTAPGKRELQPTASIILQAMLDAQSEGRRIWNWGGTWTTQTGVYRFKKKWGASEKAYAYRTFVRDNEILGQTAETLMAAYPYFFVVPFSTLRADARSPR